MTQVSSTVTSPMQVRLAARRLEFDDDELDNNSLDSAGVQPTVLAAPPEGRIPAAAPLQAE